MFFFFFSNWKYIFSAGVKLNEFIQRLGLWIGIFEHPKQVFEQDDFAGDVDGVNVVGIFAGGRPSDEFPEERVFNDLRADEIPAPRFSNVDRVEISGDRTRRIVGH